MMEYSQPANQDTPSNVQDTIVVRMTRMGLGRGNHQGQQPRVLREQAGHTSASDQCEITFKNVLLCRSYPHKTFVLSAAERFYTGSASHLKRRASGDKQISMQNGPQHHLSDQKMTLTDIAKLTSTGGTATLSNCDLQGLDLSHTNMSGWNFEKCNLTRTSFNGANLENAIFLGCRAPGASFLSALLTEAHIEGGDYSNCHFRGATLAAMRIAGCKMIGADLSDARATDFELQDCLLGLALLPKFSFRKMTLRQVDFGEAYLRYCDFRETVFEDCSLRDANLSDCRFENADLRGADLGGVTLGDAKRFKGAVISKRQAADLLGQLGLRVL